MSVPSWVEAALDAAVALGRQVDAVAVCLVGSHARGAGRADSDADIVILLPEPERLLAADDWFSRFGDGTALIRSESFGALQERRLSTTGGHEIEVGIGLPGWAAHEPVDPGTAAVVRDGIRIAYDQHGLLADLVIAACR